MIIKNGIVFCDDGEFHNVDVESQNGLLTAIGENIVQHDNEIIDASGCYVIPGLVDIHIHGAMGADFCDGTPEAIKKISRFLLKNGVTSFLGTTMTLAEEQLMNICKTASPFINVEYPDRTMLRGIQLEGPFISHEKRGAQNPDYIVKPDYPMLTRLNEACGGNVKLVVVAPEEENGLEFIQEASSLCTVSLAHSTADCEMAIKAFSSGASHATHLFNGMNSFSHREPGIIGAAMDCDAYVEIISDGIHLHPLVVRAVFKLYGDDRVCLISDSMRACGLENGQYDLGGQIVTVVGKTATIDNGSLAGSVSTLADCMRRAVEFGVPLTSALKAATINPAKSVGIDDEVGSLTIGKRADMLVIDKDLSLKKIIFGGMKIQ
ncbi:MAG: N-acetylglucosamine-6-phosphate deacetylase [Oscillospiraceae bacterium]|nr:N-acetylglucosamine-6-phosphate deacetylase [Oscillospiraceae bacterium]